MRNLLKSSKNNLIAANNIRTDTKPLISGNQATLFSLLFRTAFLVLFVVVVSLHGFGQYCTGAGPQSTLDSYVHQVLLNGQSANISYSGSCPDTPGLNDQTSQTADVLSGSSYSIQLMYGDCGSNNYPYVSQGWIDWNADSLFQYSETIFQTTGTTSDTATFTFEVPSYVCDGNVRMRILMEENGILPMNPCAEFSYGSALDFTIKVSGGNCLIPGCTDPLANNYNPNAQFNDSTCKYGTLQDCEGTIIICNDYEELNVYEGAGEVSNEIPSSSCLGDGEKNSAWYRFTSHKQGTLGFTIFPVDSVDDYDWAVYDITDFGCQGITTGNSPEVVCNFSPNNCDPLSGGDGSTGPNGNTFGPCAGQNTDRMDVDSGRSYAILVSQYEDLNPDGYRIVFDSGPTSAIYASDFVTQDYEVCRGDSVELKIVSFDGPNLGELIYTWYTPDSSWMVNETTPVTFPLESTVEIVANLKNQECVFRDTLTIEVGYAVANFGLDPENDGFPAKVVITDSSENTDNLTWIYGDGSANDFTPTGVTLEHTYDSAGIYSITQIAEFEAFQCIDTLTKVLDIPFILPNIFTPNGDKTNDLLEFQGLKKNSKIELYNRQGILITSWTIENTNEDVLFDGGNVSNGMYYYLVTGPGANPETYRGWVYISR